MTDNTNVRCEAGTCNHNHAPDNTKGSELAKVIWELVADDADRDMHGDIELITKYIREAETQAFERGVARGRTDAFHQGGAFAYKQGFLAGITKAAAVFEEHYPEEKVIARAIRKLTPDGGSEK